MPATPELGALYDPIIDRWSSPIAIGGGRRRAGDAVFVGHGLITVGGEESIFNGSDCTAMRLDTADLYDPHANSWSQAGSDLSRLIGTTSAWDGSGIVRENGRYVETWRTSPECSRLVYSKSRQRLNLVTNANEPQPYASPLPPGAPFTVWTGEDELHHLGSTGAFFRPPGVTTSDADNDGVPRATDCDDADASTYPGATEVCDFRDNDCDGSTDEQFTQDVDADADGYGRCASDCDDFGAAINPGATEVCDQLDNDCDGSIDENSVEADLDGVTTCAGDCNDSNANVWRRPTDVTNLRLSGKPATLIQWDNMKPAWGSSSVYDVAQGRLSQLRATGNYSIGTCRANNLTVNSIIDSVAVPTGDGFFYFVRGQNICGTGTYGNALRDTTMLGCP
jgi:hypothetical protein